METQHAMRQIRGENMPILILLMPFPSFRQIPSASVSFRHLPSAAVAGRVWSLRPLAPCLHTLAMKSGAHIWRPTGPGGNLRQKNPDSNDV